jgi:hypothetical protein
MDISALIQSAPQVFRDLPFLINLAQVIFYAGLVLTFGGFIMRAYSGYMSGLVRFAGRLVFGFLALLCGMGISWIIPPFSQIPLYAAVQVVFIDIILGGAIATVVLYAALGMISYNIFNLPGIEKAIQKLEGMKDRARKAEKEERASHRHGIRHPVRLAGLAAFAAFLVIGLVGFQGFPDTMTELGFTQEDMESMADQIEYISTEYGDKIGDIVIDSEGMEECMGALSLLEDQGAMATARPYSSPSAENLVEEYTGEDVTEMYSIQAEIGFYILSITQSQACLSTISNVCLCEEV